MTSGRNDECYRESSPLSMLQRDVSSFGFIASLPEMRAMITKLEEDEENLMRAIQIKHVLPQT